MWSVFKYVVDNPDNSNQVVSKPGEEPIEDIGSQDPLKTIQNEIDKNTENYIISLHYLEFPLVICYCNYKLKDTPHLKLITEYIETYKEARKILLMNKDDAVKGFYFLRNQVAVQKDILYSLDQETFDRKASESGLEPYIINDLRTIWKNRRLEQLQRALAHHVDKYYKPNKEHPLYTTFVTYLENIYKRGVDRFKTFICIGSTFIGKSIFFSKFIVPEEYYVYHSNFLEYSKMPNQPSKIFRILDDINWEQVTSTELKSLMNRNISSVNIKYGYEYIFPLIPIIIMNGEDYKAFRKHFADIWEFIERNAVIYPPQKGKEVREEEIPLFTQEEVNFPDPSVYLFNEIMDVMQLHSCTMNNMNEWIKNELNTKQSWKYDTKKYIQLPTQENIRIPNPELSRKTILKQYEEFILKKKVEEMKKPEDEKKPKEPWYTQFKKDKKTTPYKKLNKPTKFDDISFSSTEDLDDDDDDSNYRKRRRGFQKNDMSEEPDDYDDDSEYDEDDDEDDDESGSDSEPDEDFKKGFIQI